MNIKIVSAGKTEIFNFATPIGVGLIESAINLTKLCEFDRPDYLIFIGSAGSYGKLNIFDIIESKTASNIENCFFKKECYTPIDNIISLENVSHETKIVNSSNYITTNPSLAKAYLKLNIQAENMEFFSVLKVAKEYNIPAKGIFIITNYCNENAHKEYLKNIKTAKEKLISYIKEKL
jgi:nucleoside phosphorylase